MNENKVKEQVENAEIGEKKVGWTIKCFEYGQDEFEFSKLEWPQDGISFMKSEFDQLLLERWEDALDKKCFWYTLDEVQRKQLEGKFRFIVQLNTKRFKSRRKPDEFHSVKQPFESEKFNFTKVKENEVLFKIRSKEDHETKENVLIINVSPIDYGHVLFVPDVNSCMSQRLNHDSLKLCIELCLLSTHRGFRIGFNSLCAFASVNHLHFHILYVNHFLPIDNVEVNPIGCSLYELNNYPVRGFALQLENYDIHQLARRVSEITSYLYEYEIAHNLFICRHLPFNANNDTKHSTVRVFIFPKLSASVISEYAFNSAALEIAGFFPIRDEKEFEDLCENDAVAILNRFCFQEDEFDELKNKLLFLLQNLNL